jgi:hypothetical protein
MSFRDEPRGPPCVECFGSGSVSSSDRVGDPNGRDVDCESCEGSGLSCEDCRHAKHGLCGECSMDAVETMYAGSMS